MTGIFSECTNLTYLDISKFSSKSLNGENNLLNKGKMTNGTEI